MSAWEYGDPGTTIAEGTARHKITAGAEADFVARLMRPVCAEELAELEAERDTLRAIVADLAATHPQNGYHCGHCGTAMNNHALPPDTYTHAAECLWMRAREATKETP